MPSRADLSSLLPLSRAQQTAAAQRSAAEFSGPDEVEVREREARRVLFAQTRAVLGAALGAAVVALLL